jgi:hypothetical protein
LLLLPLTRRSQQTAIATAQETLSNANQLGEYRHCFNQHRQIIDRPQPSKRDWLKKPARSIALRSNELFASSWMLLTIRCAADWLDW